MSKDYKIICNKCGSECEYSMEDDGACGDPDCCGCASYWVEVKCPNCGELEDIR